MLHFAETICERTDSIFMDNQATVDIEQFWEFSNLWQYAVGIAWSKGRDLYQGVLSECSQHRPEPATNLWRSLSEITDTVAFWCDHEEQVKDWVQWGLVQECYWHKDMLDYDNVDQAFSAVLRSRQDEILRYLGSTPLKRRDTWKSRNELLTAWEVSDDNRRSLYRIRQRFPSAVVHFQATNFGVEAGIVLNMASLDILVLAQLILKSCAEKNMLGSEAEAIVVSVDEYWLKIASGRESPSFATKPNPA